MHLHLRYAISFCLAFYISCATLLAQSTTNYSAKKIDNSMYLNKVKGIKKFNIYSLNSNKIYNYLKNNFTSELSITFEGNRTYNLILTKNDLRGTNYKSVLSTPNGEIPVPKNYEVSTYSGRINGDEKQWVRLLITKNRFEGYFNSSGESFFVESLSNHTKSESDSNRIVVFSATEDDLLRICGMELLRSNNRPTEEKESNAPSTLSAANCLALEIATDADWEFYNNWGLPYANERILNFLNVVEGVYYNSFQLRFVVVFQNIYTTNNDPYVIDGIDLSTGNTAADEIRDYWNANRTNISRDLAHLFSGKDHITIYGQLDGAVPNVNSTAQIGTICSDPSQSYSFTTDRPDAYASTAHEIGHNFNAEHSDGSGCCSSGVTDITQCPNASIMCQGPKKIPIFFSNQAVSAITSYISSNDGCLGNNSTITNYPTINGAPETSATLCNSGTLALNNFYATNYSWSIYPSSLSSNGSIYPSGESCYATITDFLRVIGQASNNCASVSTTFYLYPCNYQGYVIYPNPTTNVIKIQFDHPKIKEALPDQIDLLSNKSSIPLKSIDVNEVFKKEAFINGKNIEINVENLPDGIYFLRIKSSYLDIEKTSVVRVLLKDG